MNIIQRTSSLWLLLLATAALSVGFILATPLVGGTLLDTLSKTDELRVALTAMSAQQKHAHLLITLSLDTLYPFAYGCLLAGLCLRSGGRVGIWLALPALLVIPVDLLENSVEVLALSDIDSLLPAKAILTPLKFDLLAAAVLTTTGSLIYSAVAAIRNRSTR